MRTLKISARAFICHDEVQMDGIHVRGNFWLAGDVIQSAVLQSTPTRNWSSIEKNLRGSLLKDWKENISQVTLGA